MRELSFMGPSNDGQRLLLVADDGTEFELIVDDRLISVVTREHGSAPKPTRGTADPKKLPSPREIQDRVRHGASVEEIADTADVSVDQIARFAHPVITERAHIAAQARDVVVQLGLDRMPLHQAVSERIHGRGVNAEAIRWDAWRNADGRWTVAAAYPAQQGERLATFDFGINDHSIRPADDEARWLLEQPVKQPPAEPEPKTRRPWDNAHPAARAHQRRESAVNPEHPAATPSSGTKQTQAGASDLTAEPVVEPTSKGSTTSTPHWEELLFGTTRNDDGDE